MTCSTFDLACHFWTITGPVWTFVDTWFPLATFIAGLLIGGALGWRWVLAVLTGGAAFLIYRIVERKKAPEPDYETGEPPPAAKPKKRKTLF